MVDYSSQKKGERSGSHSESIDLEDFAAFVTATGNLDFDIMLEIKDKEKSALLARSFLATMKRI
jgi:UV DNA damage endonuclease